MHNRDQPRRTHRSLCCWPLLCLLLTGCFDAQGMIDARRQTAILARLEEVDLGKFRLTLPQPPQNNELAEIQFHAFGQVANRDKKEVTDALDIHGPKLRNRLLLAARQMQLEDLEDADLHLLREQIATVINETLPGAPLHSVGFYSFQYYNF